MVFALRIFKIGLFFGTHLEGSHMLMTLFSVLINVTPLEIAIITVFLVFSL